MRKRERRPYLADRINKLALPFNPERGSRIIAGHAAHKACRSVVGRGASGVLADIIQSIGAVEPTPADGFKGCQFARDIGEVEVELQPSAKAGGFGRINVDGLVVVEDGRDNRLLRLDIGSRQALEVIAAQVEIAVPALSVHVDAGDRIAQVVFRQRLRGQAVIVLEPAVAHQRNVPANGPFAVDEEFSLRRNGATELPVAGAVGGREKRIGLVLKNAGRDNAVCPVDEAMTPLRLT